MRYSLLIGLALFICIDAHLAARGDDAKPAASEAKSRRFNFHYRFKVKGLPASAKEAGDDVRVWMPCPSPSDEQTVTRLDATAPAAISEASDARFNNRILYFETASPAEGEFTVDVPYEIERSEVLRGPDSVYAAGELEALTEEKREFYLKPDKLVPNSGKALKLLEPLALDEMEFALARQLYDLVDGHVVYKKEGTGWGRGDTNWVCDSGYGNCTDFHSLFITLARSRGLPCRFEIGFSIPTDKKEGPIAGYHCWAWFYASGRGWVPVDISEADKAPAMKEYYFGNLTADRVTFSTGRDIELSPKAANSPLNFFVYPHIEVAGKTLAKENVELQFAFEELP